MQLALLKASYPSFQFNFFIKKVNHETCTINLDCKK